MQNAAAISTVSWISLSVAPCFRARSISSDVTCLPPFCTLPANGKKRLQFIGNRSFFEVCLYICNEFFISLQTIGRDSAVCMLTKIAIILRRDVSRDHLSVGGR